MQSDLSFLAFFVFPRLLAVHVGLATRLLDSPIIDITDEDLWDSINILGICSPVRQFHYVHREFRVLLCNVFL